MVLGVYLYPKGAALTDAAGLQWLLVMGGTLLIILCLHSSCATVHADVMRLNSGYYPKDDEPKTKD